MTMQLHRGIRIFIIIAGLMATAAGPLSAQKEKKAAEPGVAGRWTMTVDGGPHGAVSMGLALKQEGRKVTGIFSSPHGDMTVEGEFTEGALKLATTGGDADSQITFDARLKEDGTLAGYLSSQMGDMKWTAERVKEKP